MNDMCFRPLKDSTQAVIVDTSCPLGCGHMSVTDDDTDMMDDDAHVPGRGPSGPQRVITTNCCESGISHAYVTHPTTRTPTDGQSGTGV